MAYECADFDSNLTAAAGDDAALREELRAAFLSSLTLQVDLLGRARCDGNWRIAAQRIKGLGKSFHLSELVEAADHALKGAPGDPVALRKLNLLCDRFTALRPSS